MSNSIHETLYPYLYLFITDIAQLPSTKDSSFSNYEKKEPGYAMPFLEAYKYAFQYSKDEPISPELFKSVNAIATAHLPRIRPGEYRNETGYFNIYAEKSFDPQNKRRVVNPSYSMTEQGAIEFIQYWLLNTERQQYLTLLFEPKVPFSKSAYSLSYLPEVNRLMWIELFPTQSKKNTEFDMTKHLPIIKMLFTNFDYACAVYSMPNSLNPALDTELQMNRLTVNYHQQIKASKTDHEKLLAIGGYIQRVEQLHPFLDGNIRTCYIILNKLLRDNDLPLTILYNPNILDCLDLANIIKMIQEGQKTYRQLLENANPDYMLLDASYTPWFASMPTIRCLPSQDIPAELLQTFAEIVLNIPPNPIASIHFSAQTQQQEIANQLLQELEPLFAVDQSGKCQEIKLAIAHYQFNLALRKACEVGECEITNKILDYQEQLKIKVEECSSNGKNALAWLQSSTMQSTIKDATIARLIQLINPAALSVNISHLIASSIYEEHHKPEIESNRSQLLQTNHFSQRFFAASKEIFESPYTLAAVICAVGIAAVTLR